jgi:hypothetical protein
MGQPQPTGCRTPSASTSRFPPRQCLRKGCECVFVPRRWNQRYCRQPECLRLLYRWQAAKRQQRWRSHVENRQQHARAERQRRSRRREETQARPPKPSPPVSSEPTPIDAPASRAWSRSKKYPDNFCDRPGCFDPVRPSRRAPARYCGDACRQAVRRVRNRERKWKKRNRAATASGRSRTVRSYRDSPKPALSSRETHQEVPKHDRETSTGRRPRPPPST